MWIRSTALILLPVLSPAAASAACGLPATIEGVPRAVAEFLLENADVVGIGVVRQDSRLDRASAERFVMAIAYKGQPGVYTFEERRTPSGDILVNSAYSSRTGKADGELALIAFKTSDGFNRIGECDVAALSSVPLEALIPELAKRR